MEAIDKEPLLSRSETYDPAPPNATWENMFDEDSDEEDSDEGNEQKGDNDKGKGKEKEKKKDKDIWHDAVAHLPISMDCRDSAASVSSNHYSSNHSRHSLSSSTPTNPGLGILLSIKSDPQTSIDPPHKSNSITKAKPKHDDVDTEASRWLTLHLKASNIRNRYTHLLPAPNDTAERTTHKETARAFLVEPNSERKKRKYLANRAAETMASLEMVEECARQGVSVRDFAYE